MNESILMLKEGLTSRLLFLYFVEALTVNKILLIIYSFNVVMHHFVISLMTRRRMMGLLFLIHDHDYNGYCHSQEYKLVCFRLI